MLLTEFCPSWSRLSCLITVLKLLFYNKIRMVGSKTNFLLPRDKPKKFKQKHLQVKRKGICALILCNHTLVWASSLCYSYKSYIQVLKEIQSRREDKPEMSPEQAITVKTTYSGFTHSWNQGKRKHSPWAFTTWKYLQCTYTPSQFSTEEIIQHLCRDRCLLECCHPWG